MFEDVFGKIRGDFSIKPMEVMSLQPLVLAYIGDAVYEAYIRTMLVVNKKTNVNMLHKMSVKYVKAKSQSDTVKRIMDKLTQDEQDVVRRGRNAKSVTVPKHAEITDYRYSTGYEALIGYLYLTNQAERLLEILRISVEDNTDGIEANEANIDKSYQETAE